MKLVLVSLFMCVVAIYALEGETKLAAGTQPCNADDFKAAQDNFARKLNIPVGDDWKKPMDLFTDIHNYYGNDPQLGLVNVCNALNAFINELNGKNIDIGTCFDPLFILKNEDVPDEALSFLGVVGALRFQCGAGLYPVLENDNWKCASKVFKSSTTQMIKAITTVLQNTQIDYVNRCQIVKQGELSYYKPLHDQCSSVEITYFGCQSYHRFFNSMYYDCKNECKLIA